MKVWGCFFYLLPLMLTYRSCFPFGPDGLCAVYACGLRDVASEGWLYSRLTEQREELGESVEVD